ncbi:MAG: transcriptional regulator [Candidatus Dormibacteraeota bacterium]|nr:transcriptional regulator [Candidatus Dormibacteraeota bacterium]
MRSYGRYCACAKALDLVGDRWTLLIVMELMILGPCRYTDLQQGLGGRVATNLLADRLREMEEAGIVRRETARPPVATSLFVLTERGHELMPVLRELGRWGAPLLAEAPADDEFRTHWLAIPLGEYLTDRSPELPPVTLELRTGDEPVVLETVEGRVRVRPGRLEHPDTVLSGPYRLIFRLLMGRMALEEALAAGVRCEGDPEVVRRVQRPAEAPTRLV